MIRLLIFLLSIVLIVGTITYFSWQDSRIVGEAFGNKFDVHSGAIIGVLVLAFLAAIYLTHKIKDIMALPGKIRAKNEQTRRARGVAALTRGLEAVAVGDASAASHHAKVARRQLDDLALTRLLTAQAAQLGGDETAATASFSAMLDAPETEFIGLKGLYLQAMTKDDLGTARGFAERAFRLRPNARWAFDSVVELGLERGAWGEVRAAIEKARHNKLIHIRDADRGAAALLTADAYTAFDSDDINTGLKEAEAALKLAPSFTPAAMLASKLYVDDGKIGKAAKIIEAAFAGEAHPALIRLFDKLYTNEIPEKRASHLRRLAAKNSEANEAILLKARAFNLLEEWKSTMEVLEPMLTSSPTAPAFALMAKAVAGQNGEDAARRWLEHAASAPRDPRPGADGEFHLTRKGWARLIHDYMTTGRLSPPPLEESMGGISADEIRLQIAPPVPEIAEPEAEEISGEEDDATVLNSEEGAGVVGDLELEKDDAPSEVVQEKDALVVDQTGSLGTNNLGVGESVNDLRKKDSSA